MSKELGTPNKFLSVSLVCLLKGLSVRLPVEVCISAEACVLDPTIYE